MRGTCGIRGDAKAPLAPEEIRGAKERLERNMQGRSYVPSDDQAPLTAKIDLELARRRCPSFAGLLDTVRNLVSDIKKGSSGP